VETQTPQYKAAFRIWCKTQIISVQGWRSPPSLLQTYAVDKAVEYCILQKLMLNSKTYTDTIHEYSSYVSNHSRHIYSVDSSVGNFLPFLAVIQTCW
jgi:hypothetical protein